MPPADCPFEIDLIETLYAMGEVTVPMAFQMAGDQSKVWPAIAVFLQRNVANLWVTESSEGRQLADWEAAAILRARLRSSGETTPPDDALSLRSAEGIKVAYDQDFAEWYYKTFGG